MTSEEQGNTSSLGVSVAHDPADTPLLPSPVGSVLGERSHSRNATQEQSNKVNGQQGNVDFGPGAEARKRRPTVDESWERLQREVTRYDDDMVKNWKEDIDTLLVFAGLFSAVVTAFVIESYQWLSEDPADTTVALLIQISAQLNASQNISPERPSFEADISSIRINCFWFLSLIFSLTSALFGLLCKQWLREHQRDTPTRTPAETLALRQLRRESFEKWGVPSFLSALPILLEVALLLFFIGVLDLLWQRHHIPFATCFVAVMLSIGLYFVTTALPTLTMPRDQRERVRGGKFDMLSYQFICPYKSPQAWVVYSLFRKLIRYLTRYRRIEVYLRDRARHLWDLSWNRATDWSSFDLRVVRQFHAHPYPLTNSDPFNMKVYELRAFQWAVAMFRDSPSMIPHLQNILGTVPPSVAMSAVLNEWEYTIWGDIPESYVELRVREPRTFLTPKGEGVDFYISVAPEPQRRETALHYPEGMKWLFCHQYWMAMARKPHVDIDTLLRSIESHHASLQQSAYLQFVIPFSVVDSLWTHEDPGIRKRSLGLLRFFEDAWRTRRGYDEIQHEREHACFIAILARHLNNTDLASELLTSSRGQQFIQFIHEQIIARRLYNKGWFDGKQRREVLISQWTKAIQRTREVGNLPADYFTPMPDPSHSQFSIFSVPDSMAELSGIRYSIDTESPPSPSSQDLPHGEAVIEHTEGENNVSHSEQENQGMAMSVWAKAARWVRMVRSVPSIPGPVEDPPVPLHSLGPISEPTNIGHRHSTDAVHPPLLPPYAEEGSHDLTPYQNVNIQEAADANVDTADRGMGGSGADERV